MTISQRIFELLKEKNKQQKDLAAYAGISASAISDWKKKGTNPSAEYIFPIAQLSGLTPRHVLKVFQRLCEQNGLPKFTMHAQRHGNASMMLANGIPDKYAMARLGQSSPNMIKNVYQHLYADKQKEYSKTISNAFSKTLATKFATNE